MFEIAFYFQRDNYENSGRIYELHRHQTLSVLVPARFKTARKVFNETFSDLILSLELILWPINAGTFRSKPNKQRQTSLQTDDFFPSKSNFQMMILTFPVLSNYEMERETIHAGRAICIHYHGCSFIFL